MTNEDKPLPSKIEESSTSEPIITAPKKKRRWDSAEPVNDSNTVSETVIITVEEKSAAVQAAIEAAKRIKANLQTGENTLKVNESDKNEQERVKEELEGKVTEVQVADKDKIELPVVKRTIDITDSKYQRYILSEIFRVKLLDLLQMGPTEQFLMTVDEDERGCEEEDGEESNNKMMMKKKKTVIILGASSEELIELAVKEIEEVAESGRSSSSSGSNQASKPITSTQSTTSQSTSTLTDKVFLGFDPIPAQIHTLRGKILGPQGSFLKHIQNETGTKVQLRGKGSGFVDLTAPPGTEPLAMHLWLSGVREEDLKAARQLCEDLIATVRADYDAIIARLNPSSVNINGSQYYSGPPTSTGPGPVPVSLSQYPQPSQYPPYPAYPQYPQYPQYHYGYYPQGSTAQPNMMSYPMMMMSPYNPSTMTMYPPQIPSHPTPPQSSDTTSTPNPLAYPPYYPPTGYPTTYPPVPPPPSTSSKDQNSPSHSADYSKS